jgi:hypothetical protein
MEKTFDCLKMKEEIQAKIYEEIKDMSSSERLAYFNRKSQTSALWQRLSKRDKTQKQRAKRILAST